MRLDGAPVGVEVQRVDAMEELELDAAPSRSAWYSGAITTSPMPAVIFQNSAPR